MVRRLEAGLDGLLTLPTTSMERPILTCPNPLIAGSNPDPSVVRVGDDYYIVTSSAEYLPGLPIYHSRDFITWTLVGKVATRSTQLNVENATPRGGAWAPTLRHHDGLFHIVVTDAFGRGTLHFTAEQAEGLMGTRTKSTIPDGGHELSNYNRFPSIEISPEHSLWAGPEVWSRLASEAQTRAGNDVPIVVIDAYPGTDVQSLTAEIQSALHEYQVIDIEGRVAHSSEHLEAMLSRTLTVDRVFGRMDHFDVQDFLDEDKLSELRREVRATDVPTVLVGRGAESVYPEAHVVAVAEMSRW